MSAPYKFELNSISTYIAKPKMGGLALVKDGNEVLANLGLESASYSELMKNLAMLSGAYLVVSWLGLTFGGPKFMDAAPLYRR